MDWTKIPTDLITKRFSDYELASIVKFQLVWAINEEQPDKKTCLRYMTGKQYDTAMTYIDSISARVSDDVSSVIKKRNAEKIRYNKNKDLSKNLPADSKQNVGSLSEQIRLDKIREDKKEILKKNTVLINEDFNFGDCEEVRDIANAYDERVLNSLYKFLMGTFLGQKVDVAWIKKQAERFANGN